MGLPRAQLPFEMEMTCVGKGTAWQVVAVLEGVACLCAAIGEGEDATWAPPFRPFPCGPHPMEGSLLLCAKASRGLVAAMAAAGSLLPLLAVSEPLGGESCVTCTCAAISLQELVTHCSVWATECGHRPPPRRPLRVLF